MSLHRLKQYLSQIIGCSHIVYIPQIVDHAPYDQHCQKPNKTFHMFMKGLVSSQKKRSRYHEKARYAYPCRCIDCKREQILPLCYLSVGTAEIIAHMDRNDQDKRHHPDQFQIIIFLIHNNIFPS